MSKTLENGVRICLEDFLLLLFCSQKAYMCSINHKRYDHIKWQLSIFNVIWALGPVSSCDDNENKGRKKKHNMHRAQNINAVRYTDIK